MKTELITIPTFTFEQGDLFKEIKRHLPEVEKRFKSK